MELLVLSDYGSKENLKKENPSESDIFNIMNTIDWNQFHQVCLFKNDYDWIEVGGNLKEDGLSAIYGKNNDQFVIDNAPTSVNQLIDILLCYLNNKDQLIRKHKFTGKKNSPDKKYDANKIYNELLESERNEAFEQNKTKKYGLVKLIDLFFFAPYYVMGVNSRFKSFRQLKTENYSLMLKQKSIIYVLSFIVWFLLISYQVKNHKQKRLDEIEKIDISDRKKKHGYE